MATEEQLQEMVAAVQNLSAEVRNLSMEVQNLKAENSVLKQLVTVREPRQVDLPPMSFPSGKFDGTPKQLKEFLDTCKVYFTFRTNMFTTGNSQVGFVISNMSGNALAWATPLVTRADPALQEYNAFLTLLKQNFKRQEILYTACEDLLDIRQGQTDVLSYISTFKRLVTETG
ncbi:protein LDOC1-like [Ambystoma mexicanum]|uniref:protein LDOC1-like n=1 Tax=Ambystoma mexicanum TaxID=8296 RepID=UPI0037E70C53